MNVYELGIPKPKKKSKVGDFIDDNMKVKNQAFFDSKVGSIEDQRCVSVEYI